MLASWLSDALGSNTVSGLLWQVALQSEVKEEAAARRRGTRAGQGSLSQQATSSLQRSKDSLWVPNLLVHTQLFTPAWEDFVSVTWERLKGAGKFLVLFGELNRVSTRFPAFV